MNWRDVVINIFIQKIIIVSSLMGLLLWIPSCAVNPVTGKQELMLLSEKDEINLGRETDAQVIKEYGIYEDAKLTGSAEDEHEGISQHWAEIYHAPSPMKRRQGNSSVRIPDL
jgi:hypothetical protein